MTPVLKWFDMKAGGYNLVVLTFHLKIIIKKQEDINHSLTYFDLNTSQIFSLFLKIPVTLHYFSRLLNRSYSINRTGFLANFNIEFISSLRNVWNLTKYYARRTLSMKKYCTVKLIYIVNKKNLLTYIWSRLICF
jgi:hypothetical protein